jgi:hypothetical protein
VKLLAQESLKPVPTSVSPTFQNVPALLAAEPHACDWLIIRVLSLVCGWNTSMII